MRHHNIIKDLFFFVNRQDASFLSGKIPARENLPHVRENSPNEAILIHQKIDEKYTTILSKDPGPQALFWQRASPGLLHCSHPAFALFWNDDFQRSWD